jgi:hypothetical protein
MVIRRDGDRRLLRYLPGCYLTAKGVVFGQIAESTLLLNNHREEEGNRRRPEMSVAGWSESVHEEPRKGLLRASRTPVESTPDDLEINLTPRVKKPRRGLLDLHEAS